MESLDIGLNEFKRMRSQDRDVLMYTNMVHIRKKLGDYQLNKKVQYIWLMILTIALGFKKFIGL